MRPRILFVVVETGATRFLLPLWRRWLDSDAAPDWRVVLAPAASRLVAREGLADALPVAAELPAGGDGLDRALGAWRPDGVLASAGDGHGLERAAVAFARARGAPVAQFVDTWLNYRRRFRNLADVGLPDRILVVDEAARAEAAAEGLPADRLRIVGHPAWEESPALPPAPRARVLFLGAPVARDFGRSLGYDEWDAWDVVRAAAERQPDLVARLWYGRHPEQTEVPAERLGPALLHEDSMALLKETGTVIGMFSSPMVDAYLGGRRVISVQPGGSGPDPCPLSRHGRVPRVGTVAQLIAALRSDRSAADDLRAALRGSGDRLDGFLRTELLS